MYVSYTSLTSLTVYNIMITSAHTHRHCAHCFVYSFKQNPVTLWWMRYGTICWFLLLNVILGFELRAVRRNMTKRRE